jgi:hypothetical protein
VPEQIRIIWIFQVHPDEFRLRGMRSKSLLSNATRPSSPFHAFSPRFGIALLREVVLKIEVAIEHRRNHDKVVDKRHATHSGQSIRPKTKRVDPDSPMHWCISHTYGVPTF